jgi:Icc-related predicted phosphoesterase
MEFLYGTDFHGYVSKYEAILAFALEHDIKLLHLGSDLLPKGSHMQEIQKKFINGYLKRFYAKCKEKGIDVLASFGNDDLYSRKKYFKGFGTLLDEVPFYKDGYEFKAYSFTCDYPFGLKTACKNDSDNWKLSEPYISTPVDLNGRGELVEIPDIDSYFLAKGTIEGDLKKIRATDKTIMSIHQPPWSLGLDVCLNGRRVGSEAVFNWIKKENPAICLHGHIHEAYDVSKIWKVKLGNTLVIQPGQPVNRTRFVLIDIKEGSIQAEMVEI